MSKNQIDAADDSNESNESQEKTDKSNDSENPALTAFSNFVKLVAICLSKNSPLLLIMAMRTILSEYRRELADGIWCNWPNEKWLNIDDVDDDCMIQEFDLNSWVTNSLG